MSLFAAAALTGANALAITALYASPAGATSAAVALAKEDDDEACHEHTGDPYYPAVAFGTVVKAVTITQPGGTTQNFSTPTRVGGAPNSGASRPPPPP